MWNACVRSPDSPFRMRRQERYQSARRRLSACCAVHRSPLALCARIHSLTTLALAEAASAPRMPGSYSLVKLFQKHKTSGGPDLGFVVSDFNADGIPDAAQAIGVGPPGGPSQSIFIQIF